MSEQSSSMLVQQPGELPEWQENGLFFPTIQFENLFKLPQQLLNCPESVRGMEETMDRNTGLSMDKFLFAAWNPAAKHYQGHVVLRVKQVESKTVKLPNNGGQKCIANALLIGNDMSEVAISGWEPYNTDIERLIFGKVKV